MFVCTKCNIFIHLIIFLLFWIQKPTNSSICCYWSNFLESLWGSKWLITVFFKSRAFINRIRTWSRSFIIDVFKWVFFLNFMISIVKLLNFTVFQRKTKVIKIIFIFAQNRLDNLYFTLLIETTFNVTNIIVLIVFLLKNLISGLIASVCSFYLFWTSIFTNRFS